MWSVGRKIGHIKKHRKEPKKKKENKSDALNAVTEEIHDVLLLLVDNVIDLGFGIKDVFPHNCTQEIMKNYVFKNYRNVYLVDGKALDIMGVEDICLTMSNGSVWKIHKIRYVLKLISIIRFML